MRIKEAAMDGGPAARISPEAKSRAAIFFARRFFF